MPARRQFCRSSWKAVSATMGISGRLPVLISCLSFRVQLMPSITGISRSIRINFMPSQLQVLAAMNFCSTSKQSFPFSACSTLMLYIRLSICSITYLFICTSSTTITFGHWWISCCSDNTNPPESLVMMWSGWG